MAKLPYDKCPSVLMVSVSPLPAVFPVVLPEIRVDERLMDIAIHAARRKSQHLPAIWPDISLGPQEGGMTSLSA
jgi:hypothetical protein